MHILLTDVLACPRCGPAFGLILLADKVEERRVLQGQLGCPNCREEYPISGGLADLRFPAVPDVPNFSARSGNDDQQALRVAALLGVRGPGQWILLDDPSGVDLAQGISALLPDIEVITLVPAAGGLEGEKEGVSRVVAGPGLPFQSGKLHGIALNREFDASRIPPMVSLLAPGARLLIGSSARATAEHLRAAGLDVLVEDAGLVLAVRRGVAHPLGRS